MVIKNNETKLFLVLACIGICVNTKIVTFCAFKEYKKRAKTSSGNDYEMYLTGHSLGGRIVQDVMYSIYYNNVTNSLSEIFSSHLPFAYLAKRGNCAEHSP